MLVVGLIAELDNSTECFDTFPLRKTHFYSTFIPGPAFVSKNLQNFYKILTNDRLGLVNVAPTVWNRDDEFLGHSPLLPVRAGALAPDALPKRPSPHAPEHAVANL